MGKEFFVKRKTTYLNIPIACNNHIHVIKLLPYNEIDVHVKAAVIEIAPNKTDITLHHQVTSTFILLDESHYPNIQTIIVNLSQFLIEKTFQIAYNQKEQCLSLYINHDAMKTVTSREKVASFRRVIHFFFPSIYYNQDDELKEEDEEEKDKDDDFGTDVSYMYSCLNRHPLKQNVSLNPIISTSPYPHQIQVISWMCSQEGQFVDKEEEERIENSKKQLHPLFIQWPGDPSYYYSPYTRYFTQEFQETIIHRNGGVICDTMGLGKTYEMLSLILTHQPSPIEYEKVSVKREYNEQVIEKIDWESFINDVFERPEYYYDKSDIKGHEVNIRDLIHPAFYNSVKQFKKEKIFCLCCDQTVNLNRGQMIQCSVCHRFQHYKCVFGSFNGSIDWAHYTCHHCLKETQSKCYSSKSTLVCVPGHIAVQWIDEIKKHVQSTDNDKVYNDRDIYIGKKNGIKYCLYPGIRSIMKSIQNDRENSILPCFLFRDFLSCFDIIIVPYNIFTAEYDSFTAIKPTFRKISRHPTCISPLFLLHYWRIVLDEVHLVESSASLMKQISILERKYTWCVSGTPFNVKFNEMFCVMVLLNIYHYSIPSVWKDCIEIPLQEHEESVIDRLSKLIRDYYWCTSMNDLQVLSPNLIPPQTRQVHTVSLEAIERTYYDEVKQACTARVFAYLAKFSSLSNDLPRHILHNVLMHLKSLRQACNHYQIGNNATNSSSSVNPSPVMSLEEISIQLLDKVRIDCEMNLRSMIAERNALAGYHILNHLYDEAYSVYQESAEIIISQEKKEIQTDYVQLVHIYNNMIDIAPSLSTPLSTEKLEEYHKKEEKYEDLYVDRAKEEMEQVKQSLLSLNFTEERFDELYAMMDKILYLMDLDTQPIEIPTIPDNIYQLYQIFSKQYSSFCLVSPSVHTTRLLNKSKSIIRNASTVMNLQIETIEGFVKFLRVWKAAVNMIRKEIYNTIFQYNERPTEEIIRENANCYSCHKRETKVKTYCTHCRYEYLLHYYSSFLYNYIPKKNVNDFLKASIKQKANTFSDNVAISMLHAVLRGGHSVIPENAPDKKEKERLIEQTRRIITELQREDYLFHLLWKKQYDYISSFDELRQCKTRIMAFPSSYEQCVQECQHRMAIFDTGFKKRLSRYNFISTVSQTAKDLSSLDCNICLDHVNSPYTILPCGHIFCSECISVYLKMSHIQRCPVCKECYRLSEMMEGAEKVESDPKVIKWGSKLGMIVNLLQEIINSEISAKILVYSQWDDSLTLLAHVLDEVNINYRVMKAKNHYDSTSEFKNDPSVSVLLMLLQQGNNGLDMSVATHIIIMEPILSATMEAQAVSRVQRIGQTSPTVVHYIIVENTIESRIYELFQKRQVSTKKQGYGIRESETLTKEELDSLLL